MAVPTFTARPATAAEAKAINAEMRGRARNDLRSRAEDRQLLGARNIGCTIADPQGGPTTGGEAQSQFPHASGLPDIILGPSPATGQSRAVFAQWSSSTLTDHHDHDHQPDVQRCAGAGAAAGDHRCHAFGPSMIALGRPVNRPWEMLTGPVPDRLISPAGLPLRRKAD
jgi:hypothetical protein